MKLAEIIVSIYSGCNKLYDDLLKVYSPEALYFVGAQCPEWFYEEKIHPRLDIFLYDYAEYFEFEDGYICDIQEIQADTPLKDKYKDKENELVWELLYIFRLLLIDNIVRLSKEDDIAQGVARELKKLFWDTCIIALSEGEDRKELIEYNHFWGISDFFNLIGGDRTSISTKGLQKGWDIIDGKSVVDYWTRKWYWQGNLETFKVLV